MSTEPETITALRRKEAASPTDKQRMEASVEKLCSLSKEDKTENAMLRSRIDEQSRLIMMLKQRADEEIIRVNTLDRANKELSDSRDEFADRWKRETHTSSMLDKRFQELALNHEEMIKIKDEYKRCNSSLRAENSRLKEENSHLFNAALQEKTQQLNHVNKVLSQLKQQHSELGSRFMEMQKTLQQKEMLYHSTLSEKIDSHNCQITTLNNTITDLQKRLTSATQELDSLRESKRIESQDLILQLTKEKNEMLELAMQRGKLINREQDVNKTMKNRITEMEKNVKNMEERFQREASAVNLNLRVRELREDLHLKHTELEEIERKFEAYKKHTNSLLQKERDLNETLRHLAT